MATNPTNFLALQREMYKALNDEATTFLGSALGNVTLSPINAGGAGWFPWFYESGNDFNNNTFLYLNRVASTDASGNIVLGQPFANAYIDVLQDISYSLDAADQATLAKSNTAAASVGNTLLSNYQVIYGTITAAQLAAAAAKLGIDTSILSFTPIDFIVQYVIGTAWAGSKGPLTYAEMLNAASLSTLLPNLPPAGAPLLSDLSLYLNAISSTVSLRDAVGTGNGLRTKLIGNTTAPTAANGGMETIDTHGVKDFQIGFIVNQSESAIQTALQAPGNNFSVGLNFSQSSQNTFNVDVNGQGAVNVGSIFASFEAKGGASYDLNEMSGGATSFKMKLDFGGVNLVTFAPTAYQQATKKGWYDSQIIKDAVANGTSSANTGYRFSPKPTYQFGPGGDFGLLNALAISQFPTITIDYSNGDYSKVSKVFSQHTDWDVKVCGSRVGEGSQSVYKSSVQQNSSGQGFSITFKPNSWGVIDPSGVPLNNTAFVLGGQITYPGV